MIVIREEELLSGYDIFENRVRMFFHRYSVLLPAVRTCVFTKIWFCLFLLCREDGRMLVGDVFFSCFGAVDDDRSKSKPRQNSKKTYNGPTTLSMQVPCLQTNNDMTNGRRDIVHYLSIAFVLGRVCILRKNQITFLVRELSLYGPLAAISVINTLSESRGTRDAGRIEKLLTDE